MSPGITELQLTDASTISIPTDAILIISILSIFALLGYLFLNFQDNHTNQFIQVVEDNSNFELEKEKLEDQLTLESEKVNHERSEKPNIKRLNLLPSSNFLRISSLAILTIGGSSLLRIQSIQTSYEKVNTNQVNIKTDNQSAKSLLSMTKIKSSNQSQNKIKKIKYIDHLLSSNNSSNNNNFLLIKERQKEDFFSF